MLEVVQWDSSVILDSEMIEGLVALERPFFDIFFLNQSLDTVTLNRIFMNSKSDHFPLFFLKQAGGLSGLVCAFPESEMDSRRLFTAASLMRCCGQASEVKFRFRNYRRELPPVRKKSFYLSKIFIKSKFRSTGGGRQAMSELYKQAIAAAHSFVSLHVAVDNYHAYKFYKAQGFSVVEENGFFYSMEKAL